MSSIENSETGTGIVSASMDTSVSFHEDNIKEAENQVLNPQFEPLQDPETLKKINPFSNQDIPFPSDALPSAIQSIIYATNHSLNFPVDFIGASILYAASVAIGNTYRVKVKRGYLETAVIYLAIVAKAGTNKSAPMSFALLPISDVDKKTYREFEAKRKEYEGIAYLSKKEREQQGIAEPIRPVWNKVLLTDFTPEALAEVHKSNIRGIGVYADELAGWFKNFDRYHKGSSMEFWLSAWNNKPIIIDRKTGNPIYIPMPHISVAGTIQTGLLRELSKQNRMENGFIDRILFVMPDNVHKTYWNESELSPFVIDSWQCILSYLLNMPLELDENQYPKPKILGFTPEAKHLLWNWQKDNTDACNRAETESIGSIYSKLEMYAVRLALIIELLRKACDESKGEAISLEAMQGALKLIEYFKRSAVKVNTLLSNPNPFDRLAADRQALYEALPDSFTTEQGLHVAVAFSVPQRSFMRFLGDKELFHRRKRGEYEKQL